MKSKVAIICILALVTGVLSMSAVARDKPAEKLAVEGPGNVPAEITGPLTRPLDTPRDTGSAAAGRYGVLGTIQYDNGVVTHVPTTSSFTYGNVFDTHTGVPVTAGPLPTGSVTMMTFFMLTGAGSDGVFVSVFGPVVGTAAPVLASSFVSLNAGSGAFNTATLAVPVSGSSFLAGVWYIGGDTVGLGTGTTMAQGHHGFVINDIVGTGFATLQSINALVRVTGSNLPVELIGFAVE